ncbi:hypothetical protein F5144DRAFT_632712, partial [Chaetomium tenue]
FPATISTRTLHFLSVISHPSTWSFQPEICHQPPSYIYKTWLPHRYNTKYGVKEISSATPHSLQAPQTGQARGRSCHPGSQGRAIVRHAQGRIGKGSFAWERRVNCPPCSSLSTVGPA